MSDSSAEKTEAPTARKRSEAVDAGRIWKSQELTVALALLGTAMTLVAVAPGTLAFLQDIMGSSLSSLAVSGRDPESAIVMFREIARRASGELVSLSLSVAATAIVIAVLQGKGTFTLEPLSPKFDKLNPLAGLRRITPGTKQAVELVKQLAKLAIVAVALYGVLGDALPATGALAQQDPRIAAAMAGDFVVRLLATAGLAFLGVAAADVLWQRYDYEQNLKMTKEEVKQEGKNQEGDPMIKARRRALGRARVRKAMLAKVPKASVVIVNPVHIAIALEYNPMISPAPIVVAMGRRKVAERIKELAREHGVPIVENRPLARAMIKVCQVGMMIPADLYTAVAEVLAFVFRQRAAAARSWQGSAVA
jgi:flagellar biosynthesis protein FlhB